MTSVAAVYERGVLRPKFPLPLSEGQTVQISWIETNEPKNQISVVEAERRMTAAKSLSELFSAYAAAQSVDEDYDLLEELNRNRSSSTS